MITYVSVVKRSPILGYNHNVRYRGLVFHVQTEDSGVQSPHVFTHLFHGGVILSTRKLVYDAGASEDVIRSLMQAQHRATLKELRRGQYDDKIDEYLGGYAGLLPRGSSSEEEGEADVRESAVKIEAELSVESRAITRNPAVTSSSPAIWPPPSRHVVGHAVARSSDPARRGDSAQDRPDASAGDLPRWRRGRAQGGARAHR